MCCISTCNICQSYRIKQDYCEICKISICRNCLIKWIKLNNTCPICRKNENLIYDIKKQPICFKNKVYPVVNENKDTINQRTGRLCPRNKEKYLRLPNQSMLSECSFIYENGRVDETGAGGCGIFDNEWLGCKEDQHYNCDCTRCIND